MTEELRKELFASISWIAALKGQRIKLIDKLVIGDKAYDRHSTRTNRFKFILTDFRLRTSGAIATLEGENISFEFRSDAIVSINQSEQKLELELKLHDYVHRHIQIQKLSS